MSLDSVIMKFCFSKKITFSIGIYAMIFFMAKSVNADLLVYEPFDYADGSTLTGQGGALGTTGLWTAHETHNGDWYVHGEGMSADIVVAPGPVLNHFDGVVENLPTSGGYVGLPGPDDVGRGPDEDFEIGRNMDASIALDPSVTATFATGTTTWFSYLSIKAWDRNEEHPNLVIGTDPAPSGSRGDNYGGIGNGFSGFGTGGGPTRNNRTRVYPMFYDAGQYSNVNGQIPNNAYNQAAFEVSAADSFVWEENDTEGNFGTPNIVVGKIQWDAEAEGQDIITVVRFLEDEILSEAEFDASVADQPNLSSANWDVDKKPDLDQSQLDVITIMGLKFFVDEIRIGTSFDDVSGGSAPNAPAFAITEIDYAPVEDTVTLTWRSREGQNFVVRYSTDLTSWELDLDDGVEADAGETTTRTFDVGGLATEGEKLYFRVERE